MGSFGEELIQPMGEALTHAKCEGLMKPSDLAAVARVAEVMLHDAYLAACDRAGMALNPAELALPPWAEQMLAEAFEQVEVGEGPI